MATAPRCLPHQLDMSQGALRTWCSLWSLIIRTCLWEYKRWTLGNSHSNVQVHPRNWSGPSVSLTRKWRKEKKLSLRYSVHKWVSEWVNDAKNKCSIWKQQPCIVLIIRVSCVFNVFLQSTYTVGIFINQITMLRFDCWPSLVFCTGASFFWEISYGEVIYWEDCYWEIRCGKDCYWAIVTERLLLRV